jgi:hypothetical protein
MNCAWAFDVRFGADPPSERLDQIRAEQMVTVLHTLARVCMSIRILQDDQRTNHKEAFARIRLALRKVEDRISRLSVDHADYEQIVALLEFVTFEMAALSQPGCEEKFVPYEAG